MYPILAPCHPRVRPRPAFVGAGAAVAVEEVGRFLRPLDLEATTARQAERGAGAEGVVGVDGSRRVRADDAERVAPAEPELEPRRGVEARAGEARAERVAPFDGGRLDDPEHVRLRAERPGKATRVEGEGGGDTPLAVGGPLEDLGRIAVGDVDGSVRRRAVGPEGGGVPRGGAEPRREDGAEVDAGGHGAAPLPPHVDAADPGPCALQRLSGLRARRSPGGVEEVARRRHAEGGGERGEGPERDVGATLDLLPRRDDGRGRRIRGGRDEPLVAPRPRGPRLERARDADALGAPPDAGVREARKGAALLDRSREERPEEGFDDAGHRVHAPLRRLRVVADRAGDAGRLLAARERVHGRPPPLEAHRRARRAALLRHPPEREGDAGLLRAEVADARDPVRDDVAPLQELELPALPLVGDGEGRVDPPRCGEEASE